MTKKTSQVERQRGIVTARRGRKPRPLRIETKWVGETNQPLQDLGEEWVRFLIETIDRQLERGELVNHNGRIKVNYKRSYA